MDFVIWWVSECVFRTSRPCLVAVQEAQRRPRYFCPYGSSGRAAGDPRGSSTHPCQAKNPQSKLTTRPCVVSVQRLALLGNLVSLQGFADGLVGLLSTAISAQGAFGVVQPSPQYIQRSGKRRVQQQMPVQELQIRRDK